MPSFAHRPRSVLDGFFTDDVAAVAAACAAIDAVIAKEGRVVEGHGPGDRSWGRVKVAEAFHARGRYVHRDGPFSETIFGPRRVNGCACGKLKGAEHRDEVCPKCGVLVGDPSLREWRFGHVETPPLLHPLLYGEVARALGIAGGAVDVQRVVHGERRFVDGRVVDAAGQRWPEESIAAVMDALDGRGGDVAGVITRVPVPPPADRPLVENLTPAQKMPWVGPVNEAWAAFLNRTNRRARLIELNAPAIIVANEARLHQLALETLVKATLSPPSIHTRPHWRHDDDAAAAAAGYDIWDDDGNAAREPQPRTPPGAPRDDNRAVTLGATMPRDLPPDDMRSAPALVFVDERTLAVQRADCADVVVVDVADVAGTERARFPSPLRRVIGARVDGGNRRVFFSGFVDDFDMWRFENEHPADDPFFRDFTAHEAVYDLDQRAFIDWPPGVPYVVVEKDEPEDLSLVDMRHGGRLASPWGGNDRPQLLAFTRDLRFAWLGSEDDGGVVDVDSGIPQVEPARVSELDVVGGGDHPGGVVDDGDGVDDAADDDDDYDDAASVNALGLTASQEWRFVHTGGVVSDGARVIDHLPSADAYAFAPDCTAIAALLGDEVRVYTGEGVLRATFVVRR